MVVDEFRFKFANIKGFCDHTPYTSRRQCTLASRNNLFFELAAEISGPYSDFKILKTEVEANFIDVQLSPTSV
jgi:hypothetical protein